MSRHILEYTLASSLKNGHLIITSLLLNHDADIEAGDDKDERPLHQAAASGHDKVVQHLLERGADIEAVSDSKTPLHIAAEHGRNKVVQHLLDQGADIDARNNHADTPLILAIERGHRTVARLLLDRGADPNARNAIGETPLTIATRHSPFLSALVSRYCTRDSDLEMPNDAQDTQVDSRDWIRWAQIIKTLVPGYVL
jgi:ankyrin repeat protein